MQDHEGAAHWAEALLKLGPPAYMILRLGAIYELSRQFDNAASLYQSALEEDFYPDAYLGLARVEAERNNLAIARQHTLNALNLRRPLGQYATPPLELLEPILNQLTALEPPNRFCRGWTATLEGTGFMSLPPGTTFVVYAANENQAQHYLSTVLAAMAGAGPRVVAMNLVWQLSPPEHQPFGMAHPGVQAFPHDRRSALFGGFRWRGPWQSHYQQVQAVVDPIQSLSACA
jgi:tetratricopeptide (TPR) repeat protein